jgi:A/G-specific adenine glycosylase
MAGMWQLPELEAAPVSGELLCKVKHAITVTNYTVRVFAGAENYRHAWRREWVRRENAEELPLTGLARKVLRKLG